MKRTFELILISLSIVALWNGCKHESFVPDDIVIPIETGNCSPDTVYFAKSVLPLLVSSCALSGCHDAITMEDGVQLTDYANVIATADVVPFQPGESDLIDVIKETDPDKIMPPPPAAALTQAQISILEKWILQGAKNWTCIETSCDTTDVRFSTIVSSVIQNKCAGCHAAVNPQGNLSLTNYSQISTIALDGRLMSSLLGQDGYMLMPQGGPALPDCEIQQIELWIADGAPDN